MAALDRTQRSGVLATESGGQPYTSLVSFAMTPDLKGLIFATPRATAKYRNMLANPRVSILIDSRANLKTDIMKAEALTLIGKAGPVRRGPRRDMLAGVLKLKHPELAGFVDAASTALVYVEIRRAVHVGRFQEVSVWEPGIQDASIRRPSKQGSLRRT